MNQAAESTLLQLELRDMKNTVAALRERLEDARAEHEAALVRAASDAVAEKTQLRATAAALTAYATLEDRRKALQAGYNDHIPKPVDPSRLIATVSRLVTSD